MRLIDADALMTEFMDSDLDHLQRDDWKEVIQIVQDAPTVQPEIIRCKDCNHFYKDELVQWCFLGKYGVKENGFCSRAERRINE